MTASLHPWTQWRYTNDFFYYCYYFIIIISHVQFDSFFTICLKHLLFVLLDYHAAMFCLH